jgi:hypothetical protein
MFETDWDVKLLCKTSCKWPYALGIWCKWPYALGIWTDESMTILDVAEFTSTRISTNRIIVLDTNTLFNRPFSGLGFILGKEYLTRLSVQIPRLTVLEMERIATNAYIYSSRRIILHICSSWCRSDVSNDLNS